MSWLDCAFRLSVNLVPSELQGPWLHRRRVAGPGSDEPQRALGCRVAPSVWSAMAVVRARTCVVDSEEETYDEDTGRSKVRRRRTTLVRPRAKESCHGRIHVFST